MTVSQQCHEKYMQYQYDMAHIKEPSYFIMSRYDLDTLLHEEWGDGFLVHTEPHVYKYMGINIAVRLTAHSGVELL